MANRISLREFQRDLASRLQTAARSAAAASLLGIQSGADFWLLTLLDAGEIIPLPTLTPVPLTKSWFCGVANIRGNLYSVIDFSAFGDWLRSGPYCLSSSARLPRPFHLISSTPLLARAGKATPTLALRRHLG